MFTLSITVAPFLPVLHCSLLVSGPTVELLCDAKAEIGLKAPSMNLRPASFSGQTSWRLYQLPGPREERTGENVVSVMSVVSGGCSE